MRNESSRPNGAQRAVAADRTMTAHDASVRAVGISESITGRAADGRVSTEPTTAELTRLENG